MARVHHRLRSVIAASPNPPERGVAWLDGGLFLRASSAATAVASLSMSALSGGNPAIHVSLHGVAQLLTSGGSRIALAYEFGKSPVLAVRIQELFGMRETPRLAGGRIPVLLHLLGPNHRPQQITSDLASFWNNTYPEVRKELRRRYPKHAWPEDPWNAQAERRPQRR